MTVKKLPDSNNSITLIFMQNMKKYDCPAKIMCGHKIIKLLLIMKLAIFTILFSSLQAVAFNGSAQQRIDLDLKDISITSVIQKIEAKYDYRFVYSNALGLDKEKVTVFAKGATIDYVMEQLLQKTSYSYNKINKGLVVIIGKGNINAVLPVTGKITDAKGQPVQGVSVVEKGTTSGAVTNAEGVFTLNVKDSNSVLTISAVGYETKEIVVGNANSLDIVLNAVENKLDEVIVVGYGTQRKKDLTGSIATISASDLTTQSNANIGQALQGKLAGVDIVSQGGQPGSGARIMIRGIGTLNNANPLYIVDGMYMSSIDDINPNDIKSIDILKDASAAAIYGSRAANGVVIITTKSGYNTDGKPIIELSVNSGIQIPEKYLQLLNAKQWAEITTLARQTINKPALEMATDLSNRPDNDWQHLMMKTGNMQNYNLSARGGAKYFTYSTGLGYLNQSGTIKNTAFQRYSGQFKSEYKRGIFTLGNNVIFSMQNRKPIIDFGRADYIGIILQTAPTLSVRDTSNLLGGYGKVVGDMVDLPNPMGIADNNLFDYKQKTYQAFINIYGQVELPWGIKYKLNYSPDIAWVRNMSYRNKYDFGLVKSTQTFMQDNQNFYYNSLIENLLSYDKSLGKSRITALLGYSYQSFANRYIMASGRGMPDGIKEVGAATEYRTNDAGLQESAMTSIISRLFYSYDNRYMITATLRRDGSSKFPQSGRYGNFPSVSLGWNLKGERFMQNVDWLNEFKLRGGYGELGNQEIGNYQYSSLITSNINYPDGNGGVFIGAFPKYFASPSIRWEETAMTNVGVDIIALNRRLSLTFDWFTKNTKGILLSVPIPPSTGASNDPLRNAGKINNTGFEFTINWNDVLNKDFSYDITFIGSAVKNEVLQMGTENGVINGGLNRTYTSTTRTLKGYPIGGFWLIQNAGIFKTQEEADNYKDAKGNKIQPAAKAGDIKFIDADDNGIINDGDRVYCGSPFPSFNAGLNFNIRYKQFDMLLGIQGVYGNKIYNGTKWELESVDKGSNFLTSVLDHWTPQNVNASFPRLVYDDPNLNGRPQSDRYLEDGSFTRIRNLQIGYTAPTLFKGVFSKARIFVSLENLFTHTKYSGYTPDINSGNATSRGFDYFVYPLNKTYMIGFNITF